MLCLYPPPVNTSSAEYMHFSAAWAARDVGCQARSKPAHTDALFYDSVVLAARGYDKAIAVATSLRGPNAVPTHGETLSAIRATEFTGATGKVSLTSYGAREARMLVGYMPTVLLEQELHPVDVGRSVGIVSCHVRCELNPAFRRFLPGQGLQIDFSSVVWPGGGTSMPPSSAPPLQQSAWLLVRVLMDWPGFPLLTAVPAWVCGCLFGCGVWVWVCACVFGVDVRGVSRALALAFVA